VVDERGEVLAGVAVEEELVVDDLIRRLRGATRRTIDQKRLAPWRTSSPR
jgi:predicted amino acid dehydrogenase